MVTKTELSKITKSETAFVLSILAMAAFAILQSLLPAELVYVLGCLLVGIISDFATIRISVHSWSPVVLIFAPLILKQIPESAPLITYLHGYFLIAACWMLSAGIRLKADERTKVD